MSTGPAAHMALECMRSFGQVLGTAGEQLGDELASTGAAICRAAERFQELTSVDQPKAAMGAGGRALQRLARAEHGC